MERLADALPVERAASRWIVSTDPDEHIEKIAPYIDLGFNHLVFHAPPPSTAWRNCVEFSTSTTN